MGAPQPVLFPSREGLEAGSEPAATTPQVHHALLLLLHPKRSSVQKSPHLLNQALGSSLYHDQSSPGCLAKQIAEDQHITATFPQEL